MKIIVGLGNPGKEYENTRHNVGAMGVDAIAKAYGFPGWQKKFKGLASTHTIAGESTLLLKPETYMNLSGQSVQAAAAFYKVKPEDILVLHDDLDLAFLSLRHKIGGGDAGHNGLKSITGLLGTPNYRRLRIGIGRPEHKSQVSDYVLSPFTPSEALQVDECTTRIATGLPTLLKEQKLPPPPAVN